MAGRFLFPQPRKVVWHDGTNCRTRPLRLEQSWLALDTVCPGCYRFDSGIPDIMFREAKDLPEEAYRLEITQTAIQVTSAGRAGAFYALVTLGQLLTQSQTLPCCTIEDAPEFPMRGFMLDISRGRVPQMQTLYRTADLLAQFKYNQIQLYIEGFSFAYPSFPECTAGKTPLTGAELDAFKIYCAERCIELVPNQNSLGHMAPWLERPEYRHLAEQEDGLEVMGRKFPPTTLDASAPESLKLVERMMDDLLPHFDSEWFNVGLDEAFELGKGKNAQLVRKCGADRLFLDYAVRLYEQVKARGKRMMMWADAPASSELLRRELPKDILLLEWGYEAEYPLEARAKALSEAGRRFCVCPGTSSWSSFTGLTDNMLSNVKTAAKTAAEYRAEGILMTDWGDMGHLQPPPTAWAGLALAGALAWAPSQNAEDAALAEELDRFVFRDAARQMGKLTLDAGRYARLEEFHMACRTLACLPMVLGPAEPEEFQTRCVKFAGVMANMAPSPVKEIYLESLSKRGVLDERPLLDELDTLCARLETTQMQCADAALIASEYRCALESVRVLTKARAALTRGERPNALAGEIAALMEQYRLLWLQRSKACGLESGLAGFARLRNWFAGETEEEK